jgi:nucleolar protein 6
MAPTKHHQDATRAERKAKKRKLQDAIPDLPEEKDHDLLDNVGTEELVDKKVKKRKRDLAVETSTADEMESREDKRARKKEKREKKPQEVAEPIQEEIPVGIDTEEAPRKSKKERKAERKAKEAAEALKTAAAPEAASNEDPSPTEHTVKAETAAKKNNRNCEKQRKGANKTPLNGEEEKAKTPAKFIVFIGMYTLQPRRLLY